MITDYVDKVYTVLKIEFIFEILYIGQKENSIIIPCTLLVKTYSIERKYTRFKNKYCVFRWTYWFGNWNSKYRNLVIIHCRHDHSCIDTKRPTTPHRFGDQGKPATASIKITPCGKSPAPPPCVVEDSRGPSTDVFRELQRTGHTPRCPRRFHDQPPVTGEGAHFELMDRRCYGSEPDLAPYDIARHLAGCPQAARGYTHLEVSEYYFSGYYSNFEWIYIISFYDWSNMQKINCAKYWILFVLYWIIFDYLTFLVQSFKDSSHLIKPCVSVE